MRCVLIPDTEIQSRLACLIQDIRHMMNIYIYIYFTELEHTFASSNI